MRASLLDRLIEPGIEASQGAVRQRTILLEQVKSALIRDLENLLNTRCLVTELPDFCREVDRSVFVYGISDHTSDNPGSPAVRTKIRLEIEKAILFFEPRLKNVSVRIEEVAGLERRLRFKIIALLVMEKESEPVSFDTYFDVNRGEYSFSR